MSGQSNDPVNTQVPWRVISYPRLPSTMDKAWLLLREKKQEGIVVTTRDQYQGRGRNGKTWLGKPGYSLAYSVTLYPTASTLLLLAPAFSLALAHCFEEVQDSNVGIKWPNDILLNGKKVAGILIETVLQGNRVSMVLGIGINLTLNTNEFEEIRNQATSLQNHTDKHIEIQSLETNIISELQRTYTLVQNGWSPVPEWKEYLTTIGHWVKVRQGSTVQEGKVIDADDCGRLLLEDRSGNIIPIASGELL